MNLPSGHNKSFKNNFARALIGVSPILLFLPVVSPAIALLLGVAIALSLGNPLRHFSKALSPHFLAIAVVGLGAGMNLQNVLQAGIDGFAHTAISIAFALCAGLALGRLLKVGSSLSLLIASGTAICGGSAIAAVAATIHAKDHDITVALAVVFILNGIALMLFPPLGHSIGLTQEQFGLWAAIAIHDTSSVVGATASYGPQALETGTTVKLVRALWIIPVTFMIGLVWSRLYTATTEEKTHLKRPWFILGFLLMAGLFTWMPDWSNTAHLINQTAQRLMVLTLFLIGTNLTRESLAHVGKNALIQGILLWLFVSVFTLWLI